MARKRTRRRKNDDFPGWFWMLFGLAIGLAVALLIYLRDLEPVQPGERVVRQQPAARPAPEPALDDNGETAPAAEAPEQRFDFYNMLPKFEVVIPEQERDVTTDTAEAAPRSVTEPGVYVLQAGSFSRYEDADRRRAQLALQGIESDIQRVSIDDRTYHRVRIGPIDDLEELNVLRSRLRQANIDVLRIRLGDQD